MFVALLLWSETMSGRIPQPHQLRREAHQLSGVSLCDSGSGEHARRLCLTSFVGRSSCYWTTDKGQVYPSGFRGLL